MLTAADGGRSCLLGGGESVGAAVELAIVLRHADNAAPLASPPRRQALDVQRSQRPTAARWRDPGPGARLARARTRAGAITASWANCAPSALASRRPRWGRSCGRR